MKEQQLSSTKGYHRLVLPSYLGWASALLSIRWYENLSTI